MIKSYKTYFSYKDSSSWIDGDVDVIKYTGSEAISRPFEFELLVKKASDPVLIGSFYDLFGKEAKLVIRQEDPDNTSSSTDIRTINGYISGVEDDDYYSDGRSAYRLQFVPKIAYLDQERSSHVYFEKTLKELVALVLARVNMTEAAESISANEFIDNIVADDAWTFRLQYNESSLDFLHRLLERHGLYYYFTSESTCSAIKFETAGSRGLISEAPISLQKNDLAMLSATRNTATDLRYRRSPVPEKITLTDYGNGKSHFTNSERDNDGDIDGPINVTVDVTEGLSGLQIKLDGLNLINNTEATAFAGRLAIAYGLHGKKLNGRSDCANIAPGYKIAVAAQAELATEVSDNNFVIIRAMHEGYNAEYLDIDDSEHTSEPGYSNTFEALQLTDEYTDYYPKLETPTPKIDAQIHATVESTRGPNNVYADLDEYGRYKIQFPFSADGADGTNSGWIRALSSYAGQDHGTHFPLLRDTKVLVGFICGDPDRPYISGALSDTASATSVVGDARKKQNRIVTAGGNELNLDDTRDSQKVKLSANSGSHLSIQDSNDGAHSVSLGTDDDLSKIVVKKYKDGATKEDTDRVDGITLSTTGMFTSTALRGLRLTTMSNEENDWNLGEINTSSSLFQFPLRNPEDGELVKVDGDTKYIEESEEQEGNNLYHRTVGHKYIYERGNEYQYNTPGDTRYHFGADKNVIICASDLDVENQTLYDRQTSRIGFSLLNRELSTYTTEEHSAREELYNFCAEMRGYMPFTQEEITEQETPQQPEREGPIEDMMEAIDDVSDWWESDVDLFNVDSQDVAGEDNRTIVLEQLGVNRAAYLLDYTAQVNVGVHNTFNIQRGNIFDFGGYWKYNLGNSYEENHISQQPELNKKQPHDLTDYGGHAWQKILTTHLDTLTNGEAWVTKSIGNSYDYTSGNLVDVHNGNTESQFFGRSYEYQKGYKESLHHGDSKDIRWGMGFSYTIGHFGDVVIGTAGELFTGAHSSTMVGVAVETFVGGIIETCIANKLDISVGPRTEMDSSLKVSAAGADLQNAISQIETLTSQVSTVSNQVMNGVSKIDNNISDIHYAVMCLVN